MIFDQLMLKSTPPPQRAVLPFIKKNDLPTYENKPKYHQEKRRLKMKYKAILIIGFWLFTVKGITAAPLDLLTKSLVPETTFESATTAFVKDYPTSGSSLDDSVDRNVPLGFSFPFGGVNYTTVNIVSNGYLRFTINNNTYYNNNTIASIDTAMPHAILPYWDDLNPSTGGNIKYSTLGSAPNRRFVTTWTNVPHYNVSGSYTFQVVLYENGSIRFRYDATSDANGSSQGGATIGVIENDTKFDQHSFNTTINASQDILYSRNMPNMKLTKTSQIISDPVNLTNNPKRIPGAIVRYTIRVENSQTTAGENILITDNLNTAISSNKINWVGNITINSPNTNSGSATALTDATDADAGEFSANNLTVRCGDISNTGPCIVHYDIEVNQ